MCVLCYTLRRCNKRYLSFKPLVNEYLKLKFITYITDKVLILRIKRELKQVSKTTERRLARKE